MIRKALRRALLTVACSLVTVPLAAEVHTQHILHEIDVAVDHDSSPSARSVAGAALDSAPIAIDVAGPPFVAVAPILRCADPIGEAATIWLQASPDGSTWGQWTEVRRDSHVNADPDHLHGDLVFFPAEARYLRYRVSAAGQLAQPLQMRLAIINPGVSQPGAESPSPRAKRLTDAGTASYSLPAYVPRSSWGASLGLQNVSTSRTPINVSHLWVHHSAGQTNNSDFAAVVRSYQTYHTATNGWADIGYNWLIDPNGTLYQGRAFRRNTTTGDTWIDVQGAHARGANSASIGVCMIGDYTSLMPTGAGLRKFVEVFGWKAHQMGLDVLASGSIGSKTYHTLSGHRDISSTACPGDTFYPYLPTLRRRVHAFLHPPLVGDLAATTDPEQMSVVRLTGAIQPQLSRTAWYFEYGTSLALDHAAATPVQEIGSGRNNTIAVQAQLHGLAEAALYYRLVAVNSDTLAYSSVRKFVTAQDTSIEEDIDQPTPVSAILEANFPNPFNACTRIRFWLPDAGAVQLSVFDVLGQHIATLAEGHHAAGEHVHSFQADDLPSGVYVYRLTTATQSLSRTMLLLR